MTARTSWFTLSNKVGVDLNHPETVAVTTAPEIPGTSHNLGDIVEGNNGSHWMFVKASATVSANNMIAIAGSLAAETLTTDHLAAGIYTIGISQMSTTAAATGQYFWALLSCKGGAVVNAYSTCQPGVQLYVHGAGPGQISSTATTYMLTNMVAASSLTSTTATIEVIIHSIGVTTSV